VDPSSPSFPSGVSSVSSASIARASDAVSPEDRWFSRAFPDLEQPLVAYFCAEFGIRSDLPVYSGGLGILAGDHLRAASDLGIPILGVGLLYHRGSYAQRIGGDGWQQAVDPEVDPQALGLQRCLAPDGGRVLARLEVAGREVAIGAWDVAVGRVRLLLLDTNLDENHVHDRAITDRLYGGGPEHRLRQEWVLGVGGVRVIRALSLAPGVWHANEGHAAFMMIERVRERLALGRTLSEAVAETRARTVFTTHTPVAAGHDVFGTDLVDHVCGLCAALPSIDRRLVHRFGRHPDAGPGSFHMTVVSLKLAGFANGVSQRHGTVARRQWQPLWRPRDAAQVPIGAITNGVHVPSWMAPEVQRLLDDVLGPGWSGRAVSEVSWERILELEPGRLWSLHVELRGQLLRQCREWSRRRWVAGPTDPGQMAGAGALLGPEVLTIGFARRFATYKRADLLLRDGERLERLLCHSTCPVQVVFAGKAHPADHGGKEILQRIWRASRDPRFAGRIALIENYDMGWAARMVRGVDLWLNVPRVPLEASGTSGMKAALNGVPQIGTLDGWWAEGYTGRNGWAIEPLSSDETGTEYDIDGRDHGALFDLLEQDVVPRFYDRDAQGVPRSWVAVMQHALYEGVRRFSAARMLRDYAEQAYGPALRGEGFGTPSPEL
jgi:starch phosphorylase